MTDISNFKRLSLAAAIVVSAFGSISVPSSAFANGTHPTSDGGAVCKGAGHCLVLELDCKGTYTDATDPNGTVYGKCSQTAQVSPKNKLKLAR
ncbi:hypothetical protein [Mesorhizobium temperatum]|uniref:DUF2282 domain-containing protein n=1 Tax=Mesorhizobium temperatum TaxID=241416 RepID=A0A271LXX1_9HYPH|nr:hypothetical protein [Mesorhizobium temperatum]PAQ12008.1 hypothetical protein CIT26_02135 [Mesorhizobium temperatum]